MNPDLLFLHKEQNHALVLEAKGGTSLKNSQLVNASRMTVADLQQSAGVGFTSSENAGFSYVMACLAPNAEEICGRLEDGAYRYAVLSFSSTHIELATGTTGDRNLDRQSPVHLPAGAPWPRQFIPYDAQSELEEVARGVTSAIVREIASGKMHFNIDDVLREAVPVWDRFHPRERSQMLNACLRVIRGLREHTDFAKLIIPAGTPAAPNVYRISRTIPKAGGGVREVRPETMHGWVENYLQSVSSASLPPPRANADEGTQLLAPWSESAE